MEINRLYTGVFHMLLTQVEKHSHQTVYRKWNPNMKRPSVKATHFITHYLNDRQLIGQSDGIFISDYSIAFVSNFVYTNSIFLSNFTNLWPVFVKFVQVIDFYLKSYSHWRVGISLYLQLHLLFATWPFGNLPQSRRDKHDSRDLYEMRHGNSSCYWLSSACNQQLQRFYVA